MEIVAKEMLLLRLLDAGEGTAVQWLANSDRKWAAAWRTLQSQLDPWEPPLFRYMARKEPAKNDLQRKIK